MISDLLFPALLAKFPDREIPVELHPVPTAIVPAISEDFGNSEICDDDDEVTVYLGKFNHVHFGNHDESLSPEEKAQAITEKVVEFVEDVLADKIVAWGSQVGIGGCYHRDKKGTILRKITQGFVWSGRLR